MLESLSEIDLFEVVHKSNEEDYFKQNGGSWK